MAMSACGLAGGAGGSTNTPPTGDETTPVPTGLETGCPPFMDEVRYPVAGHLPSGATSVRLCPGRPIIAYDGTLLGISIQPPADVLTTQVAELVDAVNGLESPPADLACPDDAGPRLNYWFLYPDGDARAVTFELFGCDVLYAGPDDLRIEGATVPRLFAEALVEQRQNSAPAEMPTSRAACEDLMTQGTTALPQIPADLKSVTVCITDGPREVRPVVLPEDLALRLEDELNSAAPATPGCENFDRQPAKILATNGWGDRLAYSLEPCGLVYIGRAAGWPRDSELALALSSTLLNDIYSLPREPGVRLNLGTTKVSPPATPG